MLWFVRRRWACAEPVAAGRKAQFGRKGGFPFVIPTLCTTFASWMSTHTYYIGMGSNVAEASELLACARLLLRRLQGSSVRFSPPVQTEPVDYPWPALFTNQVALVVSSLDQATLCGRLKRIEHLLGRRAEQKQQGVVRIDLDLLCTDGQVLRPADWERADVVEAVQCLAALGA